MKEKIITICILIILLLLAGCSKTEIIKETIIREEEMIMDYTSSNSFEKALDEDEKVDGKIVKLLVKHIKEHVDHLELNAGKNLYLEVNQDLDVDTNDYIIIEVVGQPILNDGIWVIKHEIVQVINVDEEIKSEENTKNENGEKQILITNDSSTYVGKSKDDVEKEFKDKGFEKVNISEVTTNNPSNKDGIIMSVEIDGKSFKNGELFSVNKEVIIYCWKYEESNTSKIVLPQSGTKLDKDFDSQSTSTVYYVNVNNLSNTPILKKWNSATVTDGVVEYLNYLNSLGYVVTVTDTTTKEPYAGFHCYDTNFDVSGSEVAWTMQLMIQEEDYVEYEFDIHLQ